MDASHSPPTPGEAFVSAPPPRLGVYRLTDALRHSALNPERQWSPPATEPAWQGPGPTCKGGGRRSGRAPSASGAGRWTAGEAAPKTARTPHPFPLQPRSGCRARVPPSSGSRPWHRRAQGADGGASASRTTKARGSPGPRTLCAPLPGAPVPTPTGCWARGSASFLPLPADAGSGSWFEFAGRAGFHSRQPPSQDPTGTFNLFKVEIK